MTAPAMTCPSFCTRVHDEDIGQAVVHEARVDIPQLDAPIQSPPMPMTVTVGDWDGIPQLDLGGYDFDLAGAERLLAELTVQVQVMRVAQADALLVAQS